MKVIKEMQKNTGTKKDIRNFPDIRELPTLEELAKLQGVKPVEKFEALLGDFWSGGEDIDDFIAWLRNLRSEGSSREIED